MLGCKTRGYSFTRALLGICADELHLCGDAAVVPLIQEILKVTGDDIEVMRLFMLHMSFFPFMRKIIGVILQCLLYHATKLTVFIYQTRV